MTFNTPEILSLDFLHYLWVLLPFGVSSFLDQLELIVDAVLTDKGRELISKGDGSFKITNFAPTDSEIDYGLYAWNQTEDVAAADILNTPIFEALTNESTNELYELMTLSDSKVRYLPRLYNKAGSADQVITVDEFTSGTGTPVPIKIYVVMENKSQIPAEIVDTVWSVHVDDKFLEVTNYSAFLGIDAAFGFAGYAVDAESFSNNYGGRDLAFSLSSKTIDDSLWTQYGTSETVGQRHIYTKVKVQGMNSGMVKIVDVTINEKQ